jgi:hypothetical protein
VCEKKPPTALSGWPKVCIIHSIASPSRTSVARVPTFRYVSFMRLSPQKAPGARCCRHGRWGRWRIEGPEAIFVSLRLVSHINA